MTRLEKIKKRLKITIEDPQGAINAYSYRDDVSWLIERLKTKNEEIEQLRKENKKLRRDNSYEYL